MLSTTGAFAAVGGLIALAIGNMWFLGWSRKRKLRVLDSALVAGLSKQDWHYTREGKGNTQTHRWQGQTDGIEWAVEYRFHLRSQDGRTSHDIWWHTRTATGAPTQMLFVPVDRGHEEPSVSFAQGDGRVSRWIQRLVAWLLSAMVSSRLGRGAGSLVRQHPMRHMPQADVPGYGVSAEDLAVGRRWLDMGMRQFLQEELDRPGSLLQPNDRPWLLFGGQQVFVGHSQPVNHFDSIEKLVRLGVALSSR